MTAAAGRAHHRPVRILFTSGPMYGHVNTILPLALAARDAGHAVVVATGPELVAHVAAHGLDAWSIGWTHEASGGRAALSPEYFVATGRRRATRPRAARPRSRGQPDLVIHEEMELAGAVAAAVTGARHAIHGLGVMLPRWVWEGMAPIVAELARPAHAAVFDATYLRISPPSLPAEAADQWADVRPLRPAFGRPAADERLTDELAAFLAAGDDPVVHLTLGTVFHESPGRAGDGTRRRAPAAGRASS